VLIPVTSADPIISLEDAKQHLRIDHSDDNTYVTALISAATTAVQERLGRTLGIATWDNHLDSAGIY